MSDPLAEFWPYHATTTTHAALPDDPLPREEILAVLRDLAAREDAIGDAGRVSGSLYSGDHEHYAFLGEAFEAFAHANVLQRDMYPSATKFEAEIIAMTSDLLHGTGLGVITGSGSESLITALYAYREQAAARGVTRPNVVLPVSGHVAVDKGGHWLGVEVRKAGLDAGYRADVDAVADLIDDDTVAVYASAANYPHGLIDPIEEIAALTRERGIGLHVDGCLGGWLLPWLSRLGVDLPPWDMAVEGVTSLSADTHKFAYALKGSSVLLYRDADLRARQYFTAPDWPGGLYVSPGFAGSRSGGLIASTWAALVGTGASGYLAAAAEILAAARTIRAGVEAVDGLAVIGDPTFLIAFRATDPDDVDIYLVNDALTAAGWRMNALQLPPALHFCVTRPAARPGVAEAFTAALADAVRYAREHRGTPARSGAMYGLGSTPAARGALGMVLSGYLDVTTQLPPEPR